MQDFEDAGARGQDLQWQHLTGGVATQPMQEIGKVRHRLALHADDPVSRTQSRIRGIPGLLARDGHPAAVAAMHATTRSSPISCTSDLAGARLVASLRQRRRFACRPTRGPATSG